MQEQTPSRPRDASGKETKPKSGTLWILICDWTAPLASVMWERRTEAPAHTKSPGPWNTLGLPRYYRICLNAWCSKTQLKNSLCSTELLCWNWRKGLQGGNLDHVFFSRCASCSRKSCDLLKIFLLRKNSVFMLFVLLGFFPLSRQAKISFLF